MTTVGSADPFITHHEFDNLPNGERYYYEWFTHGVYIHDGVTSPPRSSDVADALNEWYKNRCHAVDSGE